MTRQGLVRDGLRPSSLIKISCIEIDENDSYDQIIVCASRFEESLKKCGAVPNRDYKIIDLFNMALQGTEIDSLNVINEAVGRKEFRKPITRNPFRYR